MRWSIDPMGFSSDANAGWKSPSEVCAAFWEISSGKLEKGQKFKLMFDEKNTFIYIALCEIKR